VVLTDTPRVRQARRVVLELLQSSVDTSQAAGLLSYAARYGAMPDRLATGATVAHARPSCHGHALSWILVEQPLSHL